MVVLFGDAKRFYLLKTKNPAECHTGIGTISVKSNYNCTVMHYTSTLQVLWLWHVYRIQDRICIRSHPNKQTKKKGWEWHWCKARVCQASACTDDWPGVDGVSRQTATFIRWKPGKCVDSKTDESSKSDTSLWFLCFSLKGHQTEYYRSSENCAASCSQDVHYASNRLLVRL